MKWLKALGFVLLAAMITAGCATVPSGDTYGRNEVGAVERVQYGTVKAVRRVNIQGKSGFIGPGPGAIAGGIAGNSIGAGHGSAIMTVIGALAGGLLGGAAEQGLTSGQGVEITVHLDTGRTMAVVQQLSPNEIFRVGDRVRVLYGRDTTRVALQGPAMFPKRNLTNPVMEKHAIP
jgi:outer membrane lipoprotein SlyB